MPLGGIDAGHILSSLLGVGGLLVAWWQTRKQRNAREAEIATRHRFRTYRAAELISDLARNAALTILPVRSKDWKHAGILAAGLRLSLARANGSCAELLTPHEKDQLQVATETTNTLLASIPSSQRENTEEEIQKIITQLDFLIIVTAPIAERLKSLVESEEQ